MYDRDPICLAIRYKISFSVPFVNRVSVLRQQCLSLSNQSIETLSAHIKIIDT